MVLGEGLDVEAGRWGGGDRFLLGDRVEHRGLASAFEAHQEHSQLCLRGQPPCVLKELTDFLSSSVFCNSIAFNFSIEK